MKIKLDHDLAELRNYGFHLDESTSEGFIRYSRRLGNLVVTVANGQFENKVRVSMLQDNEGRIRTSHYDIMAFADLVTTLNRNHLVEDESYVCQNDVEKVAYDMDENPLVMDFVKPSGFMSL